MHGLGTLTYPDKTEKCVNFNMGKLQTVVSETEPTGMKRANLLTQGNGNVIKE